RSRRRSPSTHLGKRSALVALKVGTACTDAGTMSDTAVDDALPNGFVLDGEAPRLASAPKLVTPTSGFAAPTANAPTIALPAPPAAPSPPAPGPPVLPWPAEVPSPVPSAEPTAGSGPAMPAAAPAAAPAPSVANAEAGAVPAPGQHPMAHLMPARPAPSDAA